MRVLSFETKMIYCPKCSRAYEKGTQRFCPSDGARLVASPGAKPIDDSKGVFTNLLKRAATERPTPPQKLFAPDDEKKPSFERKYEAPNLGEKIGSAGKPPVETEFAAKTRQPNKPLPRLIRPNEIPVSQAPLGDRSVNPAGRVRLTWENPEILIGQQVKGRYQISEKLSADETTIAYLAEDKINQGKKFIVRVLMEEIREDDFNGKILAEERVSLSHINHPNIGSLIDSGELPEGKNFIVSEYVEGSSLKELLAASETFNFQRTARIVKQAADALSAAHENGVLHRNLKPQHVIVSSAAGDQPEKVKVVDFAVTDGLDEPSRENLGYLAPEQLDGKAPNYTSDIYSLAVIAHQLLIGKLPFEFEKARDLYEAQRNELEVFPSAHRPDVPKAIDEIIDRALAFQTSERYTKARDFGDAFYQALTDPSVAERAEMLEKLSGKYPSLIPAILPEQDVEEQDRVSSFRESEHPIRTQDKTPFVEVKDFAEDSDREDFIQKKSAEKYKNQSSDLAWEKRSPEPPRASGARLWLMGLGIVVLIVGAVALWNYFARRPQPEVAVAPANQPVANQQANQTGATAAPQPSAEQSPTVEIESPPLTREIKQPANSTYFQNSKENLKGDLLKNFRGFSFYYPSDWEKSPTEKQFADVARFGATGTPIEQFLVSYYDSKGTFVADAEKFPKLVAQSNADLAKALDGKYTFLSEGETRINGDWKVYEMKFTGEGVTKNGDRITLWGRRIWIPAARQGVRAGFVLTLLATSLSPEVKSADDVGEKGELTSVLQTFEPASLDSAF